MTLTRGSDAPSDEELISPQISMARGSTLDSRPRSLSGLRVSMQFFSAVLRSNLGTVPSSSHPAHPISRCSCIRVVPSFSGAIVPVTELTCFIGRLLGDNREAKVIPDVGRRQT